MKVANGNFQSDYFLSLKCEHGHKFSADDPVENSWISSNLYRFAIQKNTVITDHQLEHVIVIKNMMGKIIYYLTLMESICFIMDCCLHIYISCWRGKIHL